MSFLSQAQIARLSPKAYGKLLADTRQIGLHPQTHDPFLVSQLYHTMGTYILGNQGLGKTRQLQSLIHQDLFSDVPMGILDPHGDLTDDCINSLPTELPKEILNKIYVLDMQDEQYPFGLNVFASVDYRSQIAYMQSVERIMHIFAVLWPEVMNQAYLPRYLRAAVITLAANRGATLVDMYTFLTNDGFRQRMLQNVHDQSVRGFWQTQYDDLSASQRYQRVEPLVGRLESILMGRSLVRNIVGQRQTTINFRRAIEEAAKIFIKLPLKTIPQDARLIGTIILSEIQAAIFSFSDTPEHLRPGVSLYVDEFANFATPLFSELLTEGRKFGARVTIAHQYRGQLPQYLQAATMTTGTKICFQVSPEDAREMAHLFLGAEATVRPEDIDPKPVEYLLKYGSDNYDVQTFIDWYLLPLEAQKHNGNVEIIHPGFRAEHIPFWVLNVKPSDDKPKVPDPTPYMNNLLYQVMKTRKADVYIPGEIVYGHANCGRGFYSAFRYWWNKEKLLSPQVSYPAHLVVDAGNGPEWTRAPEDSKEQLYHFIFHLRATMEYLAAHPLGKKTSASPTDIAQEIVALPKRHAFVRSGHDVGRIVTADTLPPMDEYTALGNYVTIQLQTREKYCTQVTASQPANPHTSPDQPIVPRWEEI